VTAGKFLNLNPVRITHYRHLIHRQHRSHEGAR
jgi:hypothetical protein